MSEIMALMSSYNVGHDAECENVMHTDKYCGGAFENMAAPCAIAAGHLSRGVILGVANVGLTHYFRDKALKPDLPREPGLSSSWLFYLGVFVDGSRQFFDDLLVSGGKIADWDFV